MPQQINLCAPTLHKPQLPFAANIMVLVLAVLALVGCGVGAVWVRNMQNASQSLVTAMQTQTQEMQSLQVAIDRSKAMAKAPSPVLLQKAKALRVDMESREQLLRALQQGHAQPGYGHSDRLLLVARSIPALVWVTEVKADHARMEVSGFTLEPSALNDWVSRLAVSPLMQGLRLSTVKVQSTALAHANAPVVVNAPTVVGPEAWSFNLVSVQPERVADVASAGGKP